MICQLVLIKFNPATQTVGPSVIIFVVVVLKLGQAERVQHAWGRAQRTHMLQGPSDGPDSYSEVLKRRNTICRNSQSFLGRTR